MLQHARRGVAGKADRLVTHAVVSLRKHARAGARWQPAGQQASRPAGAARPHTPAAHKERTSDLAMQPAPQAACSQRARGHMATHPDRDGATDVAPAPPLPPLGLLPVLLFAHAPERQLARAVHLHHARRGAQGVPQQLTRSPFHAPGVGGEGACVGAGHQSLTSQAPHLIVWRCPRPAAVHGGAHCHGRLLTLARHLARSDRAVRNLLTGIAAAQGAVCW